MSIDTFASWLDQTPLSEALKNSALIIPAAQSVHILSVAIIVSDAALALLVALGLAGADWPLARWIGATGRRLGWALGALLATGTLLVAAEPTRELPNAALRLKIALLVPVIAYALWQRRRLARAEPAAAPRIATAVSLALWVVVVGLGRWIAYA